MNKKTEKNGWFYEYEPDNRYRETYDCELTDVRYVLGQQIDATKEKVLICIGINPSTALPGSLDPTLKRVQKMALKNGEYGAWYMLNVYPQRATDPQDMHTEYHPNLHRNNLKAIADLLSRIREADVWCAWGAVINQRKYLSDLLFGSDKIDGILSLFKGNFHFKAHDATTKGFPSHPLMMGTNPQLKELHEIDKLSGLLHKINNSRNEK